MLILKLMKINKIVLIIALFLQIKQNECMIVFFRFISSKNIKYREDKKVLSLQFDQYSLSKELEQLRLDKEGWLSKKFTEKQKEKEGLDKLLKQLHSQQQSWIKKFYNGNYLSYGGTFEWIKRLRDGNFLERSEEKN